MKISFVMPTRNREAVLAQTLSRLSELTLPRGVEAELIVVDNASSRKVSSAALRAGLRGAMDVRAIRLEQNRSAAARNFGAAHSRGEWVVMLDDDSYPISGEGLVSALREAGEDVGAVGGQIFLPEEHRGAEAVSAGIVAREAGGLPEVFIGCGAAIRREVFESSGGYDARFDYYAEEYDLCARLLLAGLRVSYDHRFTVMHRKSAANRDFGRIARRLVRNNAWVMQRYAPGAVRGAEVRGVFERYWRIAKKERAVRGYVYGAAEALATLMMQPRREMSAAVWDRFTGLRAAREAIAAEMQVKAFASACVVMEGKNAGLVCRALHEAGVKIVEDEREVGEAEALVVGTMSPGPMLFARDLLMRTRAGVRAIVPSVEVGRTPVGVVGAEWDGVERRSAAA